MAQELYPLFCSRNLRLSSSRIAFGSDCYDRHWFGRGSKLDPNLNSARSLPSDQRVAMALSAQKSLNKLCGGWILLISLKHAEIEAKQSNCFNRLYDFWESFPGWRACNLLSNDAGNQPTVRLPADYAVLSPPCVRIIWHPACRHVPATYPGRPSQSSTAHNATIATHRSFVQCACSYHWSTSSELNFGLCKHPERDLSNWPSISENQAECACWAMLLVVVWKRVILLTSVQYHISWHIAYLDSWTASSTDSFWLFLPPLFAAQHHRFEF